MMFELFATELAEIDRRLAAAPDLPLPEAMRTVPLEVFAELLLGVPGHLPAVAARLPSMPDDQVQRNWTGNHGMALMHQSLAFVRTLLGLWGRHSGRGIDTASVLDFGCGWGRLLRLLLHVVPEGMLYGVDSWDESIRLCRESGLRCRLAVSDEVPTTLPFPGPFDLIFAFSVFTHLSERTARTVLATLRRVVRDDGLLCLTIRPVEYWAHRGGAGCEDLAARHRATGFAFAPHQRRPAADGDITYGDTSLTLGALERLAPGWRISRVEWTGHDPLQVIVALVPT
ncbi:MAG: class I SAM-dependent methyltransferase [Planctomycetota bacterium]